MNVKILISIFIMILVSFLAVRSLNYLIKDVSYDAYKNNCKTVYYQASDRNVVLRVDDIQAHYLKDVQMIMINDALKRNKTLSLAVIPVGLLNDKEMFIFLKENRCKAEIALHGYNNIDYEFSNLSYKEADEKIKEGLKVLRQIDSKVITFIPPNNECSNESKKAAYDNGIKVISSGFQNREFGFSVSTYNWEEHKFRDYKEVLSECMKELDRNETCIIMIHPQDYVTDNKFDPEKYKQYISLLNEIDKLNASVVTFRDLYYENVTRLN